MQRKSITLSLINFLIPLTIFLAPLLVLPLTANYYSTPQQIFVIAITLILILGLSLDTLIHRSLPLSLSIIRLPITLFIGIVIVGLLANSEGRTESLTSTASFFISLAILSYFVSMVPHASKLKIHSLVAFITSTTVLAIHSLLQLTFLHNWGLLPLFMQGRSFTPTGNPLTTATLLLIGSLVSFGSAHFYSNSKYRYIYVVSATISLIATIAYASLMIPGGLLSPLILPFSASWNIMLDSLKNTHNLIFGVGLANFSSLYTSVKPIFLNSTPFWNLTPSSASSELFQWITTMGVIGTTAFIILISLGFKAISSTKSWLSPLNLLFIATTISLVLLPGSIAIYLLFFLSLGLILSADNHLIAVPQSTSYIVTVILLAFVGYISYFTFKVAIAEYQLNQARIALTKNDAKAVYQSSLKAIEQIPSMTSYRLSYSQVNLSLAAAISQKPDLTDEEKQDISQLVSQSIREAKLATALRPSDTMSWQNLGNVYLNLLTVAEGADQQALSSYAQAISLDAANPILRTEFGNLLVKLSSSTKDQAQKTSYQARANSEYQTAIQLKPDYPNAYYSLAKLLESVGDFANSASAMQKTISFLGPDNPDLSKANEELEAIKAKIPTSLPTPSPEPTI